MLRFRKLTFRELSIIIMMSTNCMLWFFESVLNMHILVVLMNMLALGLLVFNRRIFFQKNSAILYWYVLGILLSVALNGTTTRVLYRIVLIGIAVVYANFSTFHPDSVELGKRVLIFMGLLMAVTVLMQAVLKDAFSNPFYGLLTEEDRTEVLFYYKRGYYPGLNVKPHETAGLIAMAMAGMIIHNWKNRKKFLAAAMLLPMLLSGKRALTILSLVAIIVLYMAELLATGKGVKVIKAAMAVVVVGTIAVTVLIVNINNPLFARYASLFNQGGSIIDPARLSLWEDAVTVWKENVLFGIGWWNFNDLTITRFAYSKSHSVNLDYLQWLCEGGIVGFTMMMTPIVVMVVRGIKLGIVAARNKLSSKYREQVYFALFLQIFILMYALIEVPFYNNMFFAAYIYSTIVINTYYSAYRRNPALMRESA